MKVINLKEQGIKRSPSRSKYVVRWLDMSETEALSFDDYDDMRTAYHSINSFLRKNEDLYKVKQFSDQGARRYLVLKVRK
jgi:hypothetical protein